MLYCHFTFVRDRGKDLHRLMFVSSETVLLTVIHTWFYRVMELFDSFQTKVLIVQEFLLRIDQM